MVDEPMYRMLLEMEMRRRIEEETLERVQEAMLQLDPENLMLMDSVDAQASALLETAGMQRELERVRWDREPVTLSKEQTQVASEEHRNLTMEDVLAEIL